ncbi:hypothetical protein COT75_04085 [Candidatus Beckwithbacteria bacterium CG10_big_fil_rev_8_21_14_0_10_34_10]|uniref:Uncharacterized protein n=1 Tax=Candidatus Beckwithbacteria bacterium CG10_big_fil_rev_8_21_14_0_10_34_10 TaxID=1974495 RepID=A0A2H0W8N6_9BACT|nr:MAG: hypothetical protein COT75_04085 [Candidatus Beckwithbacteria bacterium CG10_big_fil_rev_8_21_14_0_10_34_10]
MISFFKKIKGNKGTIIIEMLLALAIGSAILAAVSNALIGSQQANLNSDQKQSAYLYLHEAEAAIKSLAFLSWQNISLNGTFHPQISEGDWELLENEESLGIYKRKIIISDVFREEDGTIASQGGILDPGMKKVNLQIFWETPRPLSLEEEFYLSRRFNNQSEIEDELEDFSDGIEDGTDFSINPGFIQIAQTGGGGWTEPASIGTVDCIAKASGIAANDTHIYLGLDRTWGNVEVFDISDSPATPSSQGSFDTLYRTNNLSVQGDYLYVGDDLWLLPSVTTYNIGIDPLNPPNESYIGLFYQAGGIWATQDYLFVSAKNDNVVFVYDLRDGPDDPQFMGFFWTEEIVRDLTASGNYLYVATDEESSAIEIYNIAVNPAWPSKVGEINPLYKPKGIWAESNILYLAMSGKRGAIFSLANPINPQLYGYFPTQRNLSDIAAFGDYGYAAGNDSQLKAIEVFDLSDSKGISGIYFVYGEYISSAFDFGSQVLLNRLFWESDEPLGTDVLAQIAVNDDNLTWNFVGPDGTPGSYFESPGEIPLNSMLGRYFKYKMILTGDGDTTPVVDKVGINYSL